MAPIVEIKNLEFKWPNQSTNTIDIKNFSIKPGELLFLQGPSGSGKSTLLNLIGGVLKPHKGSVSIMGTDLSSLSPSQRDKFRGNHMGFIFQMFNLLPYFSAIDNVALPCHFSKIKAKRVLEDSTSYTVEAKRLLAGLKLSRTSISKKSVVELSVGQQQRVAVARALMGKPELIIADEPTSALDANVRSLFLQLLFEECHKNQMTLIFVSHDHSLERHFDRTVSLRDLNQAKFGHDNLGELGK